MAMQIVSNLVELADDLTLQEILSGETHSAALFRLQSKIPCSGERTSPDSTRTTRLQSCPWCGARWEADAEAVLHEYPVHDISLQYLQLLGYLLKGAGAWQVQNQPQARRYLNMAEEFYKLGAEAQIKYKELSFSDVVIGETIEASSAGRGRTGEGAVRPTQRYQTRYLLSLFGRQLRACTTTPSRAHPAAAFSTSVLAWRSLLHPTTVRHPQLARR
jgi:hypothetical protein